MINDLKYYFNKRDYFIYFFMGIILFIFFYVSKIDYYKFSNSVIFTMLILYLFINKNLNLKKEKFKKSYQLFSNLDNKKYPYITNDSEMIVCLSEMDYLYEINKIEFRILESNINNFYKYKSELKSSSNQKQIYDNSLIVARNILNIINSYGVTITDDKKLENLKKNLSEIQIILSKQLTSMEIEINKKWHHQDINSNMSPIYPDTPNYNEVNYDNYNIY